MILLLLANMDIAKEMSGYLNHKETERKHKLSKQIPTYFFWKLNQYDKTQSNLSGE